MTVALVLASYCLIHLVLLGMTFHKGVKVPLSLWFLRLLLFGMFYDNLILASSPMIGQWSNYEALNIPRYILHAAILPFLAPFTLWAMRRCEIPIADNKKLEILCIYFTVIALCYGYFVDVYPLKLVPAECFGHSRLVSDSIIPPIATIITSLAIVPGGYLIWRKTKSLWFFVGTASIFVVNSAVASFPWGFIAGNGAEVVFIICLLKAYSQLIQSDTKSETL